MDSPDIRKLSLQPTITGALKSLYLKHERKVSPKHKGKRNLALFTKKRSKSKISYKSKNGLFPFFFSVIHSSTKTFDNPEFRDYMEDIPLSINGYLKDPNKYLFCIFDGHGGEESANICALCIPEFLGKFLKEKGSDVEMALKKTFAALDQEVKKQKLITVGNTATVVYIASNLFYCANVGDSSCVVVSKDRAKKVSYDDKCTDPAEIKRIEEAGGEVWDDRLDGQLAISRAIGDWDLKDKGLIAEPHIYKNVIQHNDLFCVIASDGVWDVLDEKDVYELCKEESNTDIIVEKIVNEAIEKGSEDNISCIVVAFR